MAARSGFRVIFWDQCTFLRLFLVSRRPADENKSALWKRFIFLVTPALQKGTWCILNAHSIHQEKHSRRQTQTFIVFSIRTVRHTTNRADRQCWMEDGQWSICGDVSICRPLLSFLRIVKNDVIRVSSHAHRVFHFCSHHCTTLHFMSVRSVCLSSVCLHPGYTVSQEMMYLRMGTATITIAISYTIYDYWKWYVCTHQTYGAGQIQRKPSLEGLCCEEKHLNIPVFPYLP